MSDNQQKSFVSILKSTLIFGSTQVFQMLIMLIRTKISAIFLGPLGMGMVSIYQSVIVTVTQFSSLGTFQSGIKEISNSKGKERVEIIFVFSKLVNTLSIFGVIIMILLSYPLSLLNFKSSDHAISFLLLSCAVGFYMLSQKQITVMQATRQTRSIALNSLLVAASSLIFGWIGYSQFGIKAIIPVLIITYFVQYLIGKYLIKIPKLKEVKTKKELIDKSGPILKLGIILMISVLLINTYNIIFNSIISRYGKIEDLGYYNSAFSITNGTILILISVLTSDYFPRLSASITNIQETKLIVNQQTELICLITAPISICLIIFSSVVVKILLSPQFVVIVPILQCMSLGLMFRVVWQSMSYIILSRGDKKSYFVFDALIANGFSFLLNLYLYFSIGLKGFGYSFLISSFLVAFFLVFIVRKKYKIQFNSVFLRSYIIILSLVLASFVLTFFFESNIFSLLVLFISITYSIKTILRKTGFDMAVFIKSKIKSIK